MALASNIAAKKKHTEYRKRSAYWRLENRTYDFIRFRNGYSPKAPEMLVKCRGIRRHGAGRNGYYAIRLGRVLEIKRWPG